MASFAFTPPVRDTVAENLEWVSLLRCLGNRPPFTEVGLICLRRLEDGFGYKATVYAGRPENRVLVVTWHGCLSDLVDDAREQLVLRLVEDGDLPAEAAEPLLARGAWDSDDDTPQ